MKEIGHIYLSWRAGRGKERYIVGVLKRNSTEGVTFRYFKDEVEKASKEGFMPYREFPDIDKEYKEHVLEIFGQRIMKPERADIDELYDFWEIDRKYANDNYYLLARTQGLSPLDNFEFLAHYHPVRNMLFITDIAHLSDRKLPKDAVVVGDKLSYQLDIGNKHDKYAVKVYKGNKEIGYIKKIHSKIFHQIKKGQKINILVKNVEQNGVINKIFVKIFIE